MVNTGYVRCCVSIIWKCYLVVRHPTLKRKLPDDSFTEPLNAALPPLYHTPLRLANR